MASGSKRWLTRFFGDQDEKQRSGSLTVVSLTPGDPVRFHSLHDFPQLNGQGGVCEELDTGTNRWTVRLWSDEVKSVKADNLEVVPLSERVFCCSDSVDCVLRWRAGTGDGAGGARLISLDLVAYLAGDDGSLLGRVDGHGRGQMNQDQFCKIGVKHLGSASVCPGPREESVELDLATLGASGLCKYVFIRVCPRPGCGSDVGGTLEASDAQLEVARRRGSEIFSVPLASDLCAGDAPASGKSSGLAAALFVRCSGGGWRMSPGRRPFYRGVGYKEADWEQTVINELALHAEAHIARCEFPTPSTPSRGSYKSRGSSCSSVSVPPTTTPSGLQNAGCGQNRELVEQVRRLEASGDIQGAMDAQERLLQRLLFRKDDTAQRSIDKALHKQDELRKRLQYPSLAAMASRSPHAPRAPPPTLLAEKATLDDDGIPLDRSPDDFRLPFEPDSGSNRGGQHLQWLENVGGPPPLDMFINGRPCAALYGGIFVTPMCRMVAAASRWHCDVQVVFQDGGERTYANAFTYWAPGEILEVLPGCGPLTGGREIRLTTSDMGAPISAILVGGRPGILLPKRPPTATEAAFILPPGETEGLVHIEVRAPNGNRAQTLEASEAANSVAAPHGASPFTYVTPEAFGPHCNTVALDVSGLCASRVEGVVGGLCVGGFPARRVPGGRYFEIVVDEVCKHKIRSIAVGFVACQGGSKTLCRPNSDALRAEEGREMDRAWLAGYERGGAIFHCSGRETKIPIAQWRPVSDVVVGTVLGVFWHDDEALPGPEFVICQDGEERLRLSVGESASLPNYAEGDELFAVVDLQGSVQKVTVAENAPPPARVATPVKPIEGTALGSNSESQTHGS